MDEMELSPESLRKSLALSRLNNERFVEIINIQKKWIEDLEEEVKRLRAKTSTKDYKCAQMLVDHAKKGYKSSACMQKQFFVNS